MRIWLRQLGQNQRRFPLGFLLLVLYSLLSTSAKANIGLVAGVGGVGGTFTKQDTALKTQGYGLSLDLSWHPESRGQLWPVFFGLIARQAKFGYTENAIKKTASYNMLGGGLGLYLPFSETFSMNLIANVYSFADLTVVSTNRLTLNGNNFRYSTWERYAGGPAIEGRMAFTHDKVSSGFSKRNRFRSGIGIAFLQQELNSEETEISTSNDQISPEATVSKSAVSDHMILYTVDFFIGLTF